MCVRGVIIVLVASTCADQCQARMDFESQQHLTGKGLVGKQARIQSVAGVRFLRASRCSSDARKGTNDVGFVNPLDDDRLACCIISHGPERRGGEG